MNDWYKKLKKSQLTPPSNVFGPVWGILYALMAVSLILYLFSKYTSAGIFLFVLQLAVNLSWSDIFFRQRQLCTSAIVLLALNFLVFFTFLEFKKSSYLAGILLLPYMAWILLALYLNIYICQNN
jgi:tryptophan-rich sensory protein